MIRSFDCPDFISSAQIALDDYSQVGPGTQRLHKAETCYRSFKLQVASKEHAARIPQKQPFQSPSGLGRNDRVTLPVAEIDDRVAGGKRRIARSNDLPTVWPTITPPTGTGAAYDFVSFIRPRM
jgi:hypothetical protein